GMNIDGDYNGFYNSETFGSHQFSTAVWPFQTVGAGKYYLTNGTAFRNVGTTNIDSELLAELRQKTTYPPITNYNEETELGPIISRDTNAAPDLGYHYDPIDYLFDDTVNVTFLPGTVVGFGSLGLSGGTFHFEA